MNSLIQILQYFKMPNKAKLQKIGKFVVYNFVVVIILFEILRFALPIIDKKIVKSREELKKEIYYQLKEKLDSFIMYQKYMNNTLKASVETLNRENRRKNEAIIEILKNTNIPPDKKIDITRLIN